MITHQGRTAEGGHYVGWVKKDKKKWLVFDDETVAEIDAERVKELYGGGDWHMAYMCLYRKMDTLTLGARWVQRRRVVRVCSAPT